MKKNRLSAYIIAVLGIILLGGFFSIKSLNKALNEKENKEAKTGAIATKKDVKIGILQLVSHPALDAIKKGIYEGLEKEGYKDGKNIHIEFKNAEGDQANLATMGQKLLSGNNQLVVGITTPAAQVLANKESKRPIILSGVTYPEKAGLVKSEKKPGKNVTGVSDRVNIKLQIEQIKEVMPKAKTIGILYTSSEDNAVSQAKEAKKEVEKLGLKCEMKSVTNTTDLQQIAEQLAKKVDAIYVPIDNGIASSMATLVQVTDKEKIPVFPSADTMVKDGGLMGLGVDQYQLGIMTSKVIVDILNGKKPEDYPVLISNSGKTYVNKKKAEQLNITIPDRILKNAEIIGNN